MKTKINKEKYKHYIFEYRLILFLFVGIIISLSYFETNQYNLVLSSIFRPIVMFPIYIINIMQNWDNLNLFDSGYFWELNIVQNPSLCNVFLILIITFFSVTLTLLTGENEKTKKIILYFLFIFFSFSLILKGHSQYLEFKSAQTITMGSGNVGIIISYLSIIFTNLLILTKINNKVNLKCLLEIFIKYFLTILEIFIALFIGMIFTQIKLAPDVNILNRFVFPLSVIGFGFFFFLILELIKRYLLNKIKGEIDE